jgi:energy-coupling factor transport system ATP-binding protein
VGWTPLPLSVRDARRHADSLRTRLGPVPPPTRLRSIGDVVVRASDLFAGYGSLTALRGVDLEVRAGEVVALMGRNGAGKSTLLSQLVGLGRPQRGSVDLQGAPPHTLGARDVVRRAGLVPQDGAVLLYHDTVAAECTASDRDAGLGAGTTRTMLDRLVPGLADRAHPRDLSEGQRLGLALAVVLAAEPPLVLLDEPTRGLDYAAKHRLGAIIAMLADEGRAVVIATHDVEVVAEVADRAVVLAEGEVVADGPAREVVVHSPVFAPQVAKVMAPAPWLTVAEVLAAIPAGAP